MPVRRRDALLGGTGATGFVGADILVFSRTELEATVVVVHAGVAGRRPRANGPG